MSAKLSASDVIVTGMLISFFSSIVILSIFHSTAILPTSFDVTFKCSGVIAEISTA